MAINKNFVIKNGLEVNTNVLVAAAAESQVGVGTTRPYYKLHVGGGEGNRGGIGATDITITGIATIGVANSDSGAFRVLGISTFQGDLDLLGSAGVSTVRWDASKDGLIFQDNATARFGTGEDLRIWHDGTNSYISDQGDGSLIIYGTDETLAVFTDDGSVQLYNNDTKVFETTGLGVTTYGDVVVSGVTTSARLLVTGISTFTGNVDANGGLTANTAIIEDLTNNRVVIAGTGGEIEDDANFTYDGVGLNVGAGSGVTVSNTGNIAASGIVTASGGVKVGTAFTVDANTGNVAVSGILTVGGDLNVTGDITYDEVTGRNLNITGFTTLAGAVNVDGTVDFANDVVFNGTNDITWDASESAVVFNDGAAIRVGTGSDFSIFHDGSNTYLRDSGTGQLYIEGSQVNIKNIAGEYMAYFTDDGEAALYYDDAKVFNTSPQGVNVSGVMTALRANISGIATADRFIGIHTSADGGGIGIGSTTAHVGYGITYIDFKGPGVSTVYSSSVTGITTIYFQGGGGGSGVGAAGTWQNDGAQGISTAKSVGINTVGVAVTALQGGEKGASSGIGQTFQGLYISNGMVVNDNALNGNHYIGTAFGGVMAGPVTVNGIITVDGNWAVV